MAGWQQTEVLGNVGRDPDMRYLPSGIPVCNFSVAVSRRWTDKQTNEKREETTWYRVSAWRGLAETVNQYVKKGMQVFVVGNVKAHAYMDSDGKPQATLELTADQIQFLGGRGESQVANADGEEEYTERLSDIPF